MAPLARICHKQITRAVKGQATGLFKPEAKVLRTPFGVNSSMLP